jgi:short subunit dehydrogenase-like uncharacterized protein
MAGRIVLFGATGYTGELTARALARRGARPVLAGRDERRLATLAKDLGAEFVVADATREERVRALVERGDVLVTTVGPFARLGTPAVAAAAAAGAHYLDSTGEAAFIREVFERHGSVAAGSGCGLLTAFGYDFVPGNLAGALALRDAGARAVSVDVGYFVRGAAAGPAASGGTRASGVGIALARAHAWRDGRLVRERPAAHAREFRVAGRARSAVSLGGTEAYALPRLAPLRDVTTYLGWFGPLGPVVHRLSPALAAVAAVPGARRGAAALTARLIPGSSGGPDEQARAGVTTYAVGVARDAAGRTVGEAHVAGPNPYELTAELLAWGAEQAAGGALRGAGALGPADAFGLEALEAGCAALGLRRVSPSE